MPASDPPVRALFVNGGILGLQTFGRFIRQAMVGDHDGVHAEQIVLTADLTPAERLRRRIMCARLWPDGALGLRNLDFARYRAESHAGILARDRIERLEASAGRFDVLHFHCQAAAYGSVGRLRSTPAMISIDCTQRCVIETARTELEKRTYRPNVRRDGEVFRAARLIIAASRWAQASVRAEYPDCPTEIVVRPNPVELEWFESTWSDERYQRAVAQPDRPVRVLFVGGDFPRKGGYDLFAAWAEAGLSRRARLDLVTTWAIDGGRRVPGVHVHANVTGHSAEWQALWRDADVFVLPTRDEAFGIVFQEAAAAGLPAIGTRINAVPELVVDGHTGLLVDPRDGAQLIHALDALIASPERRREMGASARRHVERTADPDEYRRFLVNSILRLARS